MRDDTQNRAPSPQLALEQLDALLGFAITLTSNKVDAEDLVQETYVRAIPALESLHPESNLKAWMFTIMRNTWWKKLRRSNAGPHFVELDTAEIRTPADDRNDPQAVCIRIWERDEIRGALEQLHTPYREIIVLCDIEGFSYKEMAEILDCPIGTIMSRLARARAKLKQTLHHRWERVENSTNTG